MVKCCVFCGRCTPKVKISKEHLIKSDLRKYLPEIDAAKGQMSRSTFLSDEGLADQRVYFAKAIGPFDQTLNRVCKPCNEGWLDRDVELPAEQVLGSSMQGRCRSLNGVDRANLARWTAKTVALRALRDPGESAVPLKYFRLLEETRTPPPVTRVWAARLDESMAWDRQMKFRLQAKNVEASMASLTTYVLGQMVLFATTFEHEGLGNLIFSAKFQELSESRIVQVWPSLDSSNMPVFASPISKSDVFSLSELRSPPDVGHKALVPMLQP